MKDKEVTRKHALSAENYSDNNQPSKGCVNAKESLFDYFVCVCRGRYAWCSSFGIMLRRNCRFFQLPGCFNAEAMVNFWNYTAVEAGLNGLVEFRGEGMQALACVTADICSAQFEARQCVCYRQFLHSWMRDDYIF
ncbi:hypothetical protein KQX54_005986 [Cotesia glomerata]|uniref:Uncharacterized protein n=1 Tax=Cotesia glomerata TaxID=32391 RepID=A0AAV7I4D6_COTGL|nr:hypothetical protein KQX54_005986 [Cotesia glomerata]